MTLHHLQGKYCAAPNNGEDQITANLGKQARANLSKIPGLAGNEGDLWKAVYDVLVRNICSEAEITLPPEGRASPHASVSRLRSNISDATVQDGNVTIHGTAEVEVTVDYAIQSNNGGSVETSQITGEYNGNFKVVWTPGQTANQIQKDDFSCEELPPEDDAM